jgi:predicted nucleic acid-binding protein
MPSPVLVDSSVWIDYFSGRPNPQCEGLTARLAAEYPIAICPPILQEVLQGFRSDTDCNAARFHLEEMVHLEADGYAAADGAAEIYRNLRKRGITIRKSSDCLIAWYALQAGCAVLHRDRDFDLMARPLKLKVLKK